MAPSFDERGDPSSECDLLLAEPAPDEPLDDTATFSNQTEVPVVVIATSNHHLDSQLAKRADLVLVDDASLSDAESPKGSALFAPIVDPSLHNPMGWKRQPANGVLAVTWTSLSEADIALLGPIADDVHLYGPGSAGLSPGHHNVRHPGPDRLAVVLKRYRAVFLPSSARSREALAWALAAVASGTPLISRPSPLLDTLLADSYVRVDSAEDVANALEQLADELERGRLAVAGRRDVLLRHTTRSRFDQILFDVGLPVGAADRITVLAATKRPKQIQHLIESFTTQDWPRKELILLLHGSDRFDIDEIQQRLERINDPVRLVPCPDRWTLGDCLNAGIDEASGRYVAKMDDDDFYGRYHLTDLILAARYSGADAVGKLANPTYLTDSDTTVDWRIDDQERFVHHLPGATMLVPTELIRQYMFRRVNRSVDSTLWERMTADGHRLYSTHWFNFVRVRHGDHTYARSDDDFLSLARLRRASGLSLEAWFA